MSLDTITLNGQSFGVSSLVGSQVTRVATVASLPADVQKAIFVTDHTFAKGNKPNRHLIKIARTVLNTLGLPAEIALNITISVPKGLDAETIASNLDGATGLAADASSLLSGTYGPILVRMENGESS